MDRELEKLLWDAIDLFDSTPAEQLVAELRTYRERMESLDPLVPKLRHARYRFQVPVTLPPEGVEPRPLDELTTGPVVTTEASISYVIDGDDDSACLWAA